MKIAHLSCVYPPYKGGIGNVASQYFENLKKLGYDIDVYTPQYVTKLLPECAGVHYEKPLLSSGNGAFLPQLFLRLRPYDIVHLHYPFFGTAEIVWLQKVLSLTRYKLVIHYHMDTPGLSSLARILSLPTRLIESSLFNQAAAITCASLDYVKNSNISHVYQNNNAKFYEIPFGVDTEFFKPDNKIKKDKKRLFFISNLDKAHYFKGVDVLLDAFAKTADKKAVLYIGGEGDMKAGYMKKSVTLGIKDRVKFLGKLSPDELVRNYQTAAVTVLPSINSHEAFGLVLIESLACGTPIIASDLPGVRSIFSDQFIGEKIKAGDSDDLAIKLNSMLNKQDLETMGKRGVSLAREKYSWEKSAIKLADIYEKILL